MKILIADDHAVVRAGLKDIISEMENVCEIHEAENGEEAIQLFEKNDFDLIILDISMPKRSGIEVLTYIKNANPETRVLILSVYPEDQYAKRVMQAGASGFVAKHSEPYILMEAINKILDGGKYISSQLAQQLAADLFGKRTKSVHEDLSLREFEILRLIASGKSLTQISEEICISVKTVSTYRSRIIDKTKLKNNIEMTKYCIENNLI